MWKWVLGKFDRASLQRGYQVYTEVCASCHSMNLLSYRNLSEVGGPSFSGGGLGRAAIAIAAVRGRRLGVVGP